MTGANKVRLLSSAKAPRTDLRILNLLSTGVESIEDVQVGIA